MLNNPLPACWKGRAALAIPALLLLAGLAVRLHGIDRPLLDHHMYRQAHTAMIARNYVERSPVLREPEIDGFGAARMLWLNEFTLYPWLVSVMYRVTGVDVIWGRLLTVLCSLGAAVCLYRIARRWRDELTAAAAMAFLLFSPVAIYQGRTFQRQSLVLFLMLLALDLLLSSSGRPRVMRVVAAGLALAAAILCNPPAALLLLPAAWVLLHRDDGIAGISALASTGGLLRAARDWRLWLFALIALAPGAVWYSWAVRSADAWSLESFGRPEFRDFTRPGYYFLWLRSDFFRAVAHHLHATVAAWPWLLLAGVGFFAARRTDHRHARVADVWLLAVLLYFMLDVYPIAIQIHDYYYLNLVPPLALFAGAGFAALWSRVGRVQKPLRIVLVAWALAGCGTGWIQARPHFGQPDPVHPEWPATLPGYGHWLLAAADMANEVICPPDALIVTDSLQPALLYYCQRRGWGVDPSLLTPEELDRLRDQGARYLLLTDTALPYQNPDLAAYLKTRCTVWVMRETHQIFILEDPPA